MTPAVAFQRSIFSKNHDYNCYIKRVFRVAVNIEMHTMAENYEQAHR